ncbi:cupin domain-containing protein [Mycobacterium sp. 21AC1]|uniref:cupin domain-containing protein n=1 Tax=[Mycobacterium] appelbergii TaxID=2939269 RepID=UPI002938E5A7|nr:cupin domain-containing protein [Mycobacterium sp. 21AC1]MDV3124167.1 cupin domain-containing protein [Mycobacterium sp. 21AC1]
MSRHDAFHPDLTGTTAIPAAQRTRVYHVKAGDLSSATAQTDGMRRLAAISGQSVGSERVWMGETHVSPSTLSANHHHGESETAIFVRSGNPVFVFHDGIGEVRINTAPGDYVFVPPYVPHREENPDPDTEAVVVIARSTQEAIVVNIPQLYALSDAPAEPRRGRHRSD